MVVKGHGLYALAVASEATSFTGRTRNTPQGTSAIACSINYDVDAQVRTSRFRCEEVDGPAVSFDHKVLPFFVCHAACMAEYVRTSWSETPARKLPRTTFLENIAEFVETVHFRNPQKTEEMPKLDGRWSTGVRLWRSFASDEHCVGTSSGAYRFRSVWRRPARDWKGWF